MFVGAPKGKHEEIAERLNRCGVLLNRLRVRGVVEDRESLKHLFQEVDLAVLSSRTEGFGMTGLEALSAGLPVVVSHNSGFGEALCSIPFGSSFVVNSEDPADWSVAIQKLWDKDRKIRLDEVKKLRESYGRKYNWAEQIKELVNKMISLLHGMNVNYCFQLNTMLNSTERKKVAQFLALKTKILKTDVISLMWIGGNCDVCILRKNSDIVYGKQ